jgi:hypothetical protein
MAHSHQRHRNAGHKRAAQFMAENRGGACMPRKRSGGAVGKAKHAPIKDDGEIETEGHRGRSRYARGGAPKMPKNINISIHKHVHPPIGPAGGPPMMPPPGPGAGLPAGLAGPARNQGGRIHAGAGSGVSRRIEYERLHGEGK